MTTQETGLSPLLKHLKQLAQTHPNKSQLAEIVKLKYHRVLNYCSREDVMLAPDELQVLAEYFGIRIYTDIVPTALTWVPHPADAAYEYEVDGMRRPTGKVRLVAVAAE